MKSRYCSSLACAVLPLVIFVLSGCASLPYIGHTESKIDDRESYRNFIMLPVPNLEADPAAAVVLGDAAISLLTLKQLFEERGFQYSSFEEADLLVGLRAAYIEPESVEFTGNALADLPNTYPGLKRYEVSSGEVMDSDTNAIASVPSWVMIVEVFRKDPLEMVWSGWCTTNNKRYFQSDENKITALRLVLENFPN